MFNGAIVSVAILGAVSVAINKLPMEERPFFLAFVAGVSYWLLLHPLVTRWYHRRRFARRPDAGAWIEFQASEDGLSGVAEGLGTWQTAWPAFSKCLHTPLGYLVYPNEQIFYWFPNRGFESNEAVEQFGRLITKHIRQHLHVT